MKKIILFAAILFAGVSVAKAQGEIAGTVKLNVHLNPIQTITIGGTDGAGNPIQNVVDLRYTTDENYKKGVKSERFKNHITIVSTGKFAVKVKAEDLKTTSGTQTIAASTISLDAFAGKNFATAIANKDVVLGNADKVLAYSNTGATNKSFDVTYKGSGDDIYANNYINGEAETLYTTTLTYTITAE